MTVIALSLSFVNAAGMIKPNRIKSVAVVIFLFLSSGCGTSRLWLQNNYLVDVRGYLQGFVDEISERDEDIFFVAPPRKTTQGVTMADIYWLNEHAILFVDPQDNRHRSVYLSDNAHRRNLATDVYVDPPDWTNYMVGVREAQAEMLRCLRGEIVIIRKKRVGPVPETVSRQNPEPLHR